MRRAGRRRVCSVEGCGSEHLSRGFCSAHYQRFRKHGTPGKSPIGAGKGDRLRWITAHANHTGNDCLRWPFSYDPSGYGAAEYEGKKQGAHRVMCRVTHGNPDDVKLHAAHSCGNRWCVNPGHIRWATPSDNQLEKHAHGRAALGERNGAAKFSIESVREARALRAEGKTFASIANQLGVCQSTVSRACGRRTWAHAD